ncbi:MAG: Potassium efflux system KefA protein / Small-conductance mechanosensitive channel [uncultured Frankineae bacterium]|uniref:Potassium efflux system KefA protein / Small-conductance mechanosensitive channel n=1 Tax=uncultured Frankineae bacterium TaxID=437475 RepID=A0A6J4MEK4_9ACTN|nr:MAG: Potassium efflux system KefA protein / Small-conductance mechanosensitive channel [uncultured Frankineae bacterium]
MVLSLQPLDDAQDWASGPGLEIVLLVTGAVLLARFCAWAGERITDRIDANARETDALVRSEASKHRHSLAQVATWAMIVAIYCVTSLLVLSRLGVPLAGLVAPATVAGVALGFGAQRIVQDLLAGFFIITERQYGFGDVVRLAVVGIGEPRTGTVEDVTLRVTTMRTVDGEVVVTPNGQIVQVVNLSRDWARAVIDIPLSTDTDIAHINAVLQEVGAQAYADESMRSLLLDAPSVMGVESLEVDQLAIRMVARTLPGKQFDVGRALRARALMALRAEGLSVGAGLDTAEPSGRP